jgi:ribonuclease J
MLFAEACGERILYTGDFRATGRKSFPALLKKLPSGVDLLIREGTHEGSDILSETEAALEKRIAYELKRREGKPVFVLFSATNTDRLTTLYKAARRSGRILLTDPVQSLTAAAAGRKFPRPGTPGVYAFTSSGDRRSYSLLKGFEKRLGKKAIAKKSFLMCVRASMGSYLKKLSELTPFEGGALVYSTWEGYASMPQTSDFLALCASLGLETVFLHTSGHADAAAVKALVSRVSPRRVQIVHTPPAADLTACPENAP